MPVQAAIISERGVRPSMEDAHFLDTNFAGRGWVYGGIYDGHGGALAAESAAIHLHVKFLEKVLAGLSPEQSFAEAYQEISEALKSQDSGTTAVDFLIRDSAIFTANAGDARAIVVGRQSVLQLTTDHRLDNEQEAARIRQRGGEIRYPYVYRRFAGIMPTRTLGDEFFKPVGVIARPSIGKHPIGDEDLMLVAACDGLFDFMDNEEIAGLARRLPEPRALV
ncbi:MAG: PP2C family protein-serine/threonine phosphatase, partial [Pseudomonadota bacterium]